ncbi:uncharacterized protein LOC126569116 [Anopheles aquasalis]|uniref:uncharacterized protein LOC126569116 n=1 Tax=Anopheles aquasalis TaxID=42839 RepID=UPI00215AF5D0|nr:uncharacterized protein LOC126569116 [Anopheles aquasalis]
MRRDLQHQHQSVLTMATPSPSQPTVLHQLPPPVPPAPQSPPLPPPPPPQPSSVVTTAAAAAAAVAASHQVSSSSCTQTSSLVGAVANALPSSGIVSGDDEECHAAAMMMMMVDTAAATTTSAGPGIGTVSATDDHDHLHHHHHHDHENGHDSSGTTTSSSSGGTSTSSSASTSPMSAPSSSASSTSSSNSSVAAAAICAASSLLLGTTGGPGGGDDGQQHHQQQQQQQQQVVYLPVELANIKEELPEPEIQADTEISLDEGHALAQALEDIPNDEAPPPEPEVQIRAGKVDESFRKLTSDGCNVAGAGAGAGTGAGGGSGTPGTMGYPAKIVHVQMGKVTYQIPDQLLKAGAINLHNPHLLTKDQLEKMITEKDPELEYRKHHNNNSTWQRYMPMFYKGIKQNYVRCLECGWLVLHKASTGTGSLLRHRCKIKLPSGVEVKLEPKANSSWNATNGGGAGGGPNGGGGGGGLNPGSGCKGSSKSAAAIAGIQANSTGTIATAPVPKFAPHHTILPQNVKEDLIRQQACVVYKDVVSAELFDQPSFRTLAQMLVNIGVYYGQQENILGSKDLLLDTVLPAMYHEAKGQLNKVLADCDLTFSCSLLRNPAERRAYVAINAYTVASDYYFRQINVKTLDVTGQEHAYVEHLQRIIEDCMARSFSEPLKVVVGGMVEDGGAAAATAYRSGQYEVIPCVVTILWTIMKTIMESLGYDSARYFERHFFPAPEDSESLPPEYAAIDRFMDAFREPIRSLVSDTSVTISEVVLWKKKLEQCFHVDDPAEGEEEEEEEEEERMVKKAFLVQMAEVFQLHDYHRVAVFLDPKFKGLRFLSEAEREETIATVKALLHTDQDGIERVKSQYANGSTKKRNSLVQSELKFYEFMDSSLKLECDDVVDDEIKQYIDVKLECAVDIMSYWRTETAFPLLKRLCRRILNIPAACDEMKLLFGQTGRDLQKRRLMLSEKEIDMVMYLHQNSP